MSAVRFRRVGLPAVVVGLLVPLAFTGASAASTRSTSDACGSSVTVHAPAAGRTQVTPVDVGLPARAAALTAAASRVHAHWLTSIQCRTLPRNNRPRPSSGPTAGHTLSATRTTSMAATEYTYNWAGYNVDTTRTPSAVTAAWTEPTVSLPAGSTEAHSAVWVGLGGGTSPTEELVQDGTGQDAYLTGTDHFFWFELYPRENAELITSLALSPGDQVSATSSGANGMARFGLCNLTSARCVSFSQSSPAPGNTVEWIVEAPEVNSAQAALPVFNPVPFSNASFQAPTSQALAPGTASEIDMVDQLHNVIAAPGGLCGGAFTVFDEASGTMPSPTACPSVPRSVHLSNGPSGGALTTVATWAPPAIATPAVSAYEVRIQGRSPQGTYTPYRYATVSGASTRLNIAGTRGYLYRVQVVARNSAGFGPWSGWSNPAYPR